MPIPVLVPPNLGQLKKEIRKKALIMGNFISLHLESKERSK
jgi:hypothetical protein